ncbi:hypothetical protein II941_03900 [bacterium]|nr:hypothetical protein [bacterium]
MQTKLQSKLDKNDADLLNKTSEIVQLKQSLAKLNIEKNELTSQLYDQKINVVNANNELTNKDHLLKELTDKLDLQTNQTKQLTTTNANLVKEINNLQNQNATLRNQLEHSINKIEPTNLLTNPTELLKTLTILIPSTKKISLNTNLTTLPKLHVLYLSINDKLYPVTSWMQVINTIIKVLYAAYQGQFIAKL